MPQETPRRGGGFKHFSSLLLLTFALGVLFWFAPTLYLMIEDLIAFLFSILGFSFLLFLPLALALGLVARFRPRLLWLWWHRWLGLIVLIFWLSGVLAFREAATAPFIGGKLGHLMLGNYRPVGIIRVILLGYLGWLLLSPRTTLLLTRETFRWTGLSIKFLALQFARGSVYLGKRVRALALVLKPRPRELVLPSPGVEPVLERSPVTLQPAPMVSQEVKEERPQKAETASPVITSGGWQLPPLDLLAEASEGVWGQLGIEEKARRLEEALASYGVEARVIGINVGPAVTQFEVEPGWDRKFKEIKEKDPNGNVRVKRVEVSRTRVKVEKIQALANDLALSLAAPSIRIEAPVPGKSVVGIEVPNTSASIVTLRSVVESPTFQKLKNKTKLAIALGKGAGGEAVVADLAAMPHLLIAGATGSGKTVCLNAVICCLLLHNTPDDLKLMLIDPKRVELIQYNPIPHLIMPVITDSEKAIEALKWLNQEMDFRYKRMAEVRVRNIQEYNKMHLPPMPYIVLFIDELADLMMMASGEVEQRLCRLAQLARATGIHLVVATQRPSVDVITGLIKANFPSRISFAVTSQVDSRTILDMVGAEKLLGKGDMLFLPGDAPKPRRLQGCYVSDAEILRLASFWGAQRREERKPEPEATFETEEDPLMAAARKLASEYRQLSPSFLQRRLQIGYSRAVKLIEALEREGALKQRRE